MALAQRTSHRSQRPLAYVDAAASNIRRVYFPAEILSLVLEQLFLENDISSLLDCALVNSVFCVETRRWLYRDVSLGACVVQDPQAFDCLRLILRDRSVASSLRSLSCYLHLRWTSREVQLLREIIPKLSKLESLELSGVEFQDHFRWSWDLRYVDVALIRIFFLV